MRNQLYHVVAGLNTFETVEAVVEGLELILANLLPHDKRRVFLTAYLLASRHVVRLKNEGYYEDAAWVSRYSAIFGDQYRQVLLDYERHNFDCVPGVWLLAFNEAHNEKLLMPQHLALGMNAHMGRDLPYAITEVGLDNYLRRYRDHNRINDALLPAIAQSQQRLCRETYPSVLRSCLDIIRPVFVRVGIHTFRTGRELAWKTGTAVLRATTEEQRRVLWHQHESRAVQRAARIIRLSRWKVVESLQRLELR